MGLLRWIVRCAIRRRMRQVRRALEDPVATQERLLLDMVRKARRTEWGRSHDYARIRSVGDFQRAVPVTCYEDMAPLWHRAFDGARDVTWPGHIEHFTITSGTTTGIAKSMPISRAMGRANRRAGTALLGLCCGQTPGTDLLGGKTLYFGGDTRLTRRGACWEGTASGIAAAHLPRLAYRFRLPEPEVAAIDDWEERVGTIAARYADSDVRAVAGLPVWSLLLFRRLAEVARERTGRADATVRDLWPELALFVGFGMALAPYRERLDELAGRPLAYVRTYSSSEGGLNAVQSEQGDAAMRLDVDAGVFYEFVPRDELDADRPRRLTLAEVEPGVDYGILLTTPSGIWAYDVGDVVRFTSLSPPKIVFAGRSKLLLNEFGEHVIEEELEDAAAAACAACDARVADFTVASVYPTSADSRSGHRWLVEFDGPAPSSDAFAARLDQRLVAVNLDYKLHRRHDFAMRPPRVIALAPGTFYQWARRHGQLGGQHKVPRIARSHAMADELLDISRSLSQAGDSTPSPDGSGQG
ncbi:MAG: GH3 family domain-containing protein [bacterium]